MRWKSLSVAGSCEKKRKVLITTPPLRNTNNRGGDKRALPVPTKSNRGYPEIPGMGAAKLHTAEAGIRPVAFHRLAIGRGEDLTEGTAKLQRTEVRGQMVES